MSSTWTRFPGLDGTVKALRLPAPLPLGLLIRRSVPCAPARFVVSLSRSGAGAGLLRAGGWIVRAGRSHSSDACTWTRPGLPGSLVIRPVALRRSPTPVGPVRLARGGGPGAAPAVTTTKAPALKISRFNTLPLTGHRARCSPAEMTGVSCVSRLTARSKKWPVSAQSGSIA